MDIRTVEEFPVRLKNALLFMRVKTLKDLDGIPNKLLRTIPGVGKKNTVIIQQALEKYRQCL